MRKTTYLSGYLATPVLGSIFMAALAVSEPLAAADRFGGIVAVDEIMVLPPFPAPEHQVNVALVFRHRQGCGAPRDKQEPRVYRSGAEIHVDFEAGPPAETANSGIPCASRGGVASLTVPIWPAMWESPWDSDHWTVVVGHWRLGELARTAFDIYAPGGAVDSFYGPPLGGLIAGYREIERVVCRNLRTGKRRIIPGGTGTFDCSDLKTKPRDGIEIKVIGKPFAP